jgi:hypothetical protein
MRKPSLSVRIRTERNWPIAYFCVLLFDWLSVSRAVTLSVSPCHPGCHFCKHFISGVQVHKYHYQIESNECEQNGTSQNTLTHCMSVDSQPSSPNTTAACRHQTPSSIISTTITVRSHLQSGRSINAHMTHKREQTGCVYPSTACMRCQRCAVACAVAYRATCTSLITEPTSGPVARVVWYDGSARMAACSATT